MSSFHPLTVYRFCTRPCPAFQASFLSELLYSLTWVLSSPLPRWPFPSPSLLGCHQPKPTWACLWMSPEHLLSWCSLLRGLLCIWTHIIREVWEGVPWSINHRGLSCALLLDYHIVTPLGACWKCRLGAHCRPAESECVLPSSVKQCLLGLF